MKTQACTATASGKLASGTPALSKTASRQVSFQASQLSGRHSFRQTSFRQTSFKHTSFQQVSFQRQSFAGKSLSNRSFFKRTASTTELSSLRAFTALSFLFARSLLFWKPAWYSSFQRGSAKGSFSDLPLLVAQGASARKEACL